MPAKKRAYTIYRPEFKVKAVAQFNATPVRERGALADKLGVTYANLYNWSRKVAEGGVEALYTRPGRGGKTALPGIGAKKTSDGLTRRQERVLADLQESCNELKKLRETYAEREAMVLAHIKRLTKSLGHSILTEDQ